MIQYYCDHMLLHRPNSFLFQLTFQLINFFATAVQFAEESIDEGSTAIDVVIALASK